MGHTAGTLAAGIAATLCMAGAAAAATVTYPDGKSEKLAPDREVTGPAVITSDSGKGTIRLRSGAVLRYLPKMAEGERTVENMFLSYGIADVDLDFDTRLATPAFWVLAESAGKRVRVTVTSLGTTRGENSTHVPTSHARAAKESGLVRLMIGQRGKAQIEAHLLAGQGAEMTRRADGAIGFRTDADNEWRDGRFRLIHPLDEGRSLDLYVPKASEGSLDPIAGAAADLRVSSRIWSWTAGGVLVLLAGREGETVRTMLIPGDHARTDGGALRRDEADPWPPEGGPATVARENSSRGIRPGTRFLSGRLEVVEMVADLTAEKPTLSFVLERTADGPAGPLPGKLEWSIEIQRLGSGHMWHQGRKYPVEGPLEKAGDRVTITKEWDGSRPEVAGAWPDLQVRVTK